jgi:hypothetical protein
VQFRRRAALVLGGLLLVASAVPADAKATLVKRSTGTVEAHSYSYSTSSVSFVLTGSISFGNRTFKGTASGGASWFYGSSEPPFQLHGSAPDGDLDAICLDRAGMYDATPTAGYLQCTGHVGDGATTTTRLVVALPEASGGPGQYHGYAYDYSGVFAG